MITEDLRTAATHALMDGSRALVRQAADEIERLTLTEDEIDAIEQAAREAEAHCHREQAETLRSLLDRVMTTEQVRARCAPR